MRLLVALVALSLTAPAQAGSPIPSSMPVDGLKTQVVTIGSMHLREFKDWSAPMLGPLIAKLATFKPEVVTVEGVAGEQCEMARARPKRYEDVATSYCWDPAQVRGDTKMSVVEALDAADAVLHDWPSHPSAAQRRKLAMLFVAGGELPSARVQWLRLPLAERHAGDGLTQPMIDALLRMGKGLNESYDVAAAVAAGAGLDRIFLVDDHTSDGVFEGVAPGYEAAIRRHFEEAGKSPVLAQYKADTAAIKDGADLLNLYRKMNARGAMTAQISADFGGAMGQPTPAHFGRMYLGWWETRNLRMVANVRESFAARPGTRVLNIVGASHKPWYDALLGAMADVTVVDAAEVLR